ncbi:MAG: VCBS repeat-containing protein [Verrucomicrobia subdivision 3 bacterium]|nr:VCBS repeat-containing protein [Limisphaerales bacterium]
MKSLIPCVTPSKLTWIVVSLGLLAGSMHAQLFNNLQILTQSIPVGSGETDPNTGKRVDGPKWVCAADFDLDGNQDFATCHLNGEVYVGWGRGDGSFAGPQKFPSGTSDLRAIVSGDFNGDGRPDIAATAPYDGVVTLLFSTVPRGFAAPSLVPSFKRGRNLEPGDFDGDGILDLAVAGPDEVVSGTNTNQVVTGVLHLRGTGGGVFVRMGNVAEAGLAHLENSKLKPVFSLESFRRPGETRDTLAVTHEHSSKIWVLRIGTNGVLQVAHALSWFGNQAQPDASPYYVDSLKVGTVFSPITTGQSDLIAVMQQA